MSPSQFDESPVVDGQRSPKGQAFIEDLRADVRVQRATQFDHALLEQIDRHPSATLRECWEAVEARFAKQSRTNPRPWNKVFDN